MIIILEGPDGSGKSTFARYLTTVYPQFRLRHEGPPPQDIHAIKYYSDRLEELRELWPDYVLDRFAFGERIYGPWYRGKDGLGDIGWNIISRQLTYVPHSDIVDRWLHILCLPPYQVCLSTWASGREELIKDPAVFKATYDAYVEAGHVPGLFDVVYDYTDPLSLENVMHRIDDMVVWDKFEETLPDEPSEDIPF